MIRLKNVHKAFGNNAVLNGVDLHVPKGESMVIIGGSGTGKSVTLKCILGLVKPDIGTITVADKDIKDGDRDELIHLITFVCRCLDWFGPHRGSNHGHCQLLCIHVCLIGMGLERTDIPDGLDHRATKDGDGCGYRRVVSLLDIHESGGVARVGDFDGGGCDCGHHMGCA